MIVANLSLLLFFVCVVGGVEGMTEIFSKKMESMSWVVGLLIKKQKHGI